MSLIVQFKTTDILKCISRIPESSFHRASKYKSLIMRRISESWSKDHLIARLISNVIIRLLEWKQIWSKLVSASWSWSPIDMVVLCRRVYIRNIPSQDVCVLVHCFGRKHICAHVSWIASGNSLVQTFLIRFSRIYAWFLSSVFEYSLNPRKIVPDNRRKLWYPILQRRGIHSTCARIRISTSNCSER